MAQTLLNLGHHYLYVYQETCSGTHGGRSGAAARHPAGATPDPKARKQRPEAPHP
jgi:hypothetical protein